MTTHDTLNAALGLMLCDSVNIKDSSMVIKNPLYKVLNFNGPTHFGEGLQLDTLNGKWCWDIGPSPEYIGNFGLSVAIFDMTNICETCIPVYADTAYYDINVTGFEVSIEVVHDQLQGHFAEVSIFLDSSLSPNTYSRSFLDGFDFLIAYDASALTAMSVAPGALIDKGKFEYFTYRFGPFGNCNGDCPSGMLRIVSMREENDGVVNPCHLTEPGELAKMNFIVTNDYNFAGQFAPIQFYWIDCGDNSIIDETDEWVYLALNIFDHEGVELNDPAAMFGYSGPEDSCYDTLFTGRSLSCRRRVPALNFRNGGISIIPIVIIDDRGDINLNGIPDEIADAVVFSNYFIYGPAAFTINFESQKAATEVNGDGVALTVADFVYLVRIINGDALPNQKVNPDASACFSVQGNTVKVVTNVELGAALLVFNGNVTPTLAMDVAYMDVIYNQAEDKTRVLIYSFEQADAITTGDLLYLAGTGKLIAVETAEYRGTMMNATIAK